MVETLDLIKTRQIRQARIKARLSGKVKVHLKEELVITKVVMIEGDSKELVIIVEKNINNLNVIKKT